ncbi:hypothetical protein [Mangrovibacterium diazotrophicum]|uniref:Uncharacterized protein n=1 Tax=Mangrovibacterium diazotrophicum TaxID=1261403 RepID=A0A419W8K2_9BACT|nr:hypothetical protein [Mangrovibacterium diazotrophicum]RKD91779.1 hypothetical protein BC643_2144 [Mangrovibacterium diazotrophicum]
MPRVLLLLFFCIPFLCFGQTEVGPDSYFLYLAIAFILGVPLILYLVFAVRKRGKLSFRKWFRKGKVEVELVPNRKYRPDVLTLVVHNKRTNAVDLESPVLIIRKLWSVRKFKLKGINRAEIYPLYLESGKTHELHIKLDVFHKHDSSLRSYYWARVLLKDTSGLTYSTNYITLRKSLVS